MFFILVCFSLWDSDSCQTCCLKVSVVIKQHDQKQLGDKQVYFISQSNHCPSWREVMAAQIHTASLSVQPLRALLSWLCGPCSHGILDPSASQSPSSPFSLGLSVSCSLAWPQTHFIDKDNHELEFCIYVLKCWDCRKVLPKVSFMWCLDWTQGFMNAKLVLQPLSTPALSMLFLFLPILQGLRVNRSPRLNWPYGKHVLPSPKSKKTEGTPMWKQSPFARFI